MRALLEEKKYFIVLFIVIGMLHVGMVVFFGMQKEGYHEDELYSFATSVGEMNSTPRDNYFWKSGYQIQQEFMVVEGNEFAISDVIQNQVEDVHPPLFYLMLNMLMSLFPGRFFKWFGIGLNLIYSLVTLGGILYFFDQLEKSKDKKWYVLITGLVYAVSPAVISNVMLIRMYAFSGMWTVLYACLFLRLIQDQQCGRKRFAIYTVCGAVICYLAFLTHYFALLLPFCFTLGYCVYAVITKKKILRMLMYGLSMLAAIGLAIITYPASLKHIFYGYRGTGVQSSLANLELIGMTKTFLIILNENVFGGILVPIALVAGVALAAGCILALRNRKTMSEYSRKQIYIFSVSFIGCLITSYFLTKSALLVGADSCRFFYPVLALLLPLMAYGVCKSFYEVLKEAFGEKRKNVFLKGILTITIMIPIVMGFARDNVLFLYRENAQLKEQLQEYSEYPAIMIYNRNAPYRSWYMADQLWMFSQVYYLDWEHFAADFKDETLETAEKMVVYVDDTPEYLEKLLEMNNNLEKIELLGKGKFFYIYGLE